MSGNKYSTITLVARTAFLATFAALTVMGIIQDNDRNRQLIGEAPAFFHSTVGEKSDFCGKPEAVFSEESVSVPLPTVSAKGAALVCADTGELVYGKSSDVALPMASTTKIMTALTVLESGIPLDSTVCIPKEAVGIEGSSIYLFEGEKITVLDLLYGLLLESGNDAATALAIAVSGSEADFVAEMNKMTSELGLSRTAFANPHGLSADGHFTTAYELGKITCAAMKHDIFRKIVGTRNYSTVPITEGAPSHYFVNHNRMLRLFDGANGVKTGYTIASGRCLVSSADRGGGEFIAVTLDDRNDWKDHAEMLEFAFANYECRRLFSKGEIALTLGGTTFANADEGNVLVKKGDDGDLQIECRLGAC